MAWSKTVVGFTLLAEYEMVTVAGGDHRNWRVLMSGAVDVGAVFDEHVAAEFAENDVDATMRTMVEPYVWHVPALTGAAGGRGGAAVLLHRVHRADAG
jgi:hypothetical protein